jgi:hypothetical protein
VDVVPKGTEYVSLQAANILPDSLPSSEHRLRDGPITGTARFVRFVCFGQECNARG